MTHEYIRDFCLKKKGVTEEFPFDSDTLVFKVMNKIFLLTSLESYPVRINLKCDPELAIELREKYEAVYAAYHMNKKHWNSVEDDGSISLQEIIKMINHSYDLVVAGLPKKLKEQLFNLP
ncbi:MAG: MmcQ/YjbR family DNA-binding protein [Chitinophagales bacterium]